MSQPKDQDIVKSLSYGLTVPITLLINSSSTISTSKVPSIIASVFSAINVAVSDGTSEDKSYRETKPVSMPPQ